MKLLAKTRGLLENVRRLSRRVEDRQAWQHIQARANQLESALTGTETQSQSIGALPA